MSVILPSSRIRPLARYLIGLWPLPVFFTVVQGVMLLNGNSAFLGLPYWISDVDMLVFLLCFGAAGLWTYRPLSGRGKLANGIDLAMAQLPQRALKAFTVSGMAYGVYLLVLVLISVSAAGNELTGLMLVALLISISFCALLLVPALGVAITLHHVIQQRMEHPIQAEIEQIRLWNPLHRFIGSTTRPWLLFTITGLIPTSFLALFAYFASMETTPQAQHFIAGQGLLLFVAGLLASICLVWLITRSLKMVTGELSKGLEHLRQARFDGRIAVLTDDDLGSLARGLNMALSGLQEREELKGSLAMAAEIQQGLLPEMPCGVANYAFAALEQSCQAVGGDYYDVIRLHDGRYWLVVADVAGKGYPAALTVANLHAMLHVLAAQDVPFDEAIAHINQSLCQTLTQGRFVTLFMAKLQPESHSMLWLNAGHVPPLLQTAQGIERLQANTPPLGVLADMPFTVQRIDVAAGDRLFVYTDGVTEAQDSDGGEMFGEARLLAWLRDARTVALADLPQQLLAQLEEFGGDSRDDDVTILCVEREET